MTPFTRPLRMGKHRRNASHHDDPLTSYDWMFCTNSTLLLPHLGHIPCDLIEVKQIKNIDCSSTLHLSHSTKAICRTATLCVAM